MKFENENCPICGEGQWADHSDGTHTFRHKNKEHNVTGMHYALCDHCGTRGFLKGQITANKKRIAEYEDRLRDYISPSNILRIRERYDLSQKDAAKIFQCGPTQFSKWERGIVAPTGATAVLLRLALNDPEVMRKLAADAGVAANLPAVKPVQAVAPRHLQVIRAQDTFGQPNMSLQDFLIQQFQSDLRDVEIDRFTDNLQISQFVDKQAEMTAATHRPTTPWILR